MASSSSSRPRKRPVHWIGFCGRCETHAETRGKYLENPHPNGCFCPYESSGGGIRGVMHFKPSEDQSPEMIAEDIGLDSSYNELFTR